MRNRWGVEVKKGYHVWAHHARGGMIEGKVREIYKDSAYGPRVVLDSGYTVALDDVSQVLPPMRVLKDGTVKANPLARKRINDPSQATGLPPDERLKRRRRRTAAMPIPGVWANPLSTEPLDVPAIAGRDNGNGKRIWYVRETPSRGMDWGYTDDFAKATPLSPHWQKRFASNCQLVGVRCLFLEADDLKENPLSRVSVNSPSQRARKTATGGKTKRPSKRLTNRREYTDVVPAGFYANPAPIKVRYANVENDGGFSFGMDDRTPVAFVLTERERKGRGWYTSYRLPGEVINSPQFQQWANEKKSLRFVCSLNELRRMLKPFVE